MTLRDIIKDIPADALDYDIVISSFYNEIEMHPGTHDYVVHQSHGVVHVVEFETTEFPPSNRQFDTWETNKPTPCVQMVIDNVIQTYGTDTDA